MEVLIFLFGWAVGFLFASLVLRAPLRKAMEETDALQERALEALEKAKEWQIEALDHLHKQATSLHERATSEIHG